MEWLLTNNNESSLVLFLTVLGSFATLLGGFGSLLMLQPSKVRRLLLSLLIMIGLAEVFLVGWGINLRLAKAASVEKDKTLRPRPNPAPRASPKEIEVKPEQREEQAMVGGVTFNISSRSDVSIRRQYCVDSNLSGTLYKYAGRLMVKLNTANFDLCKNSSDGQRQIEFKVGVGTHNDITKRNWRGISWTQPQKGLVVAGSGAELTPEKPLAVSMKRFSKNKPGGDLANYGVVVSVYNRDRRGLYYISDERN
jgi:hypothetical protein